MIHICASLLAADFTRLGEEVQRAERAGVDSFHFDIMDGHYVRNFALAPNHLKALRPYSQLPFHAHLELNNPDHVLFNFAPLQADVVIVQWNTLVDPARTFKRIRSQNMKVGLGLSPDDTLAEASLFFQDIDQLLILGVSPGFGGQSMLSGTVEKIAAARNLADQSGNRFRIAVDGGVNPDTIPQVVNAGADILIMGTALFKPGNMTVAVRAIREAIAQLPHR
jgi:ribulose-phosphate 3-epimerase